MLASSATPEEYKLEELITIALTRNSSILEASKELEHAELTRSQAIAVALPDIDLAATYTYHGKSTETQFLGQTFNLTPDETKDVEITVSQWLYSGAVNAAISGTKHLTQVSVENLADVRNKIVTNVRIFFYDLLLAKEELEVYQESLQQLESNLDDARKRSKAGVGTNYDVMRFQTKVASAYADLLKAKTRYQSAKLNLAKIVGLTPSEQFDIEGSLDYNMQKFNLEEQIEYAYKYRSDLNRSRESVLLQESFVKQKKSDRFINIKLFGVYNYTDHDGGDAATAGFEDSWYAGVRLTLPLFDGNERRAVVKQEIVKREIKLIQSEDLYRSVAIETEDAYNELMVAQEYLKSQEENIDLAHETFRIASKQYNESITTQLEYLETQLTLTKARLELNVAKHACLVATERLKLATGKILPNDV